jgi:hypothetical protein
MRCVDDIFTYIYIFIWTKNMFDLPDLLSEIRAMLSGGKSYVLLISKKPLLVEFTFGRQLDFLFSSSRSLAARNAGDPQK